MMGPIGATELLIVLVVLVFLCGARKLPELARGTGQSLRIFREEVRSDTVDDPDEPPSAARCQPEVGSAPLLRDDLST